MLQERCKTTRAAALFAAAILIMAASAVAAVPPAACPVQTPPNLAALAGPQALAGAVGPGPRTSTASTGDVDAAAQARERDAERAVFAQLLADRSKVPAPATIDAPISAQDRASITDAASAAGRLKVGANVVIGRAVDFTGAAAAGARFPLAAGPGFAAPLADGGAVWETEIASAGAKAIRVHLGDVALAAGVELFVYNEAGRVRGPFTGRGPASSGDFWTPSVFGDRVRIQVRASTLSALARSHFTIAAISHLGPRFGIADQQARSYEVGPAPDDIDYCGFQVPDCTVNAACALASNPGFANAFDAIAQYDFVDADGTFICTGTLINPTGSQRTPYFLTANHCLSTNAVAQTVEAHFQFHTAACDTSCIVSQMTEVDGATLQVTGAANALADFTLLRMSSAPAGLKLLGWSAGHPADGNYLIHLSHPAGAPLAYSVRRIRYDPSVLPQCSSARPTFLYSGFAAASTDWEGAATGGSSGSAALLLTADSSDTFIVGQLYGGCSAGAENDCDPNGTAFVDGALEYSFPYLRPFIYERIFSSGFD